jgi:hypothetical protein
MSEDYMAKKNTLHKYAKYLNTPTRFDLMGHLPWYNLLLRKGPLHVMKIRNGLDYRHNLPNKNRGKVIQRYFFTMAQQPPSRQRPPDYQGFMIILRHTTFSRTSVDEWSALPPSDNTQHSQETGIHDPGGIRIHNPSKRAAADPRLRPRGHWNRQPWVLRTLWRSQMRKIGKIRVNQSLIYNDLRQRAQRI